MLGGRGGGTLLQAVSQHHELGDVGDDGGANCVVLLQPVSQPWQRWQILRLHAHRLGCERKPRARVHVHERAVTVKGVICARERSFSIDAHGQTARDGVNSRQMFQIMRAW
jgi:hypothetical protein